MKKFKLLLIISSLLVSVLLLAGCNGNDTEETTAASDTGAATEAQSTEPATLYTTDSLVFDTFEDMKANVELFKSQIPCERSTKGYHAVDDGGAATYSIVSETPEGIFEKLADGVFVTVVLGEGELPNPQMFGAYGDGKHNDYMAITKAIRYATENELDLALLESDYYTLSTITLDTLTVRSANALINYHGAECKPAVLMKNNVDIYGNLNIYFSDDNPGSYRAAMYFGDYLTGVGSSDCYVESVTITGGAEDSNGVAIIGDSHDIQIDYVKIPSGTKVCRGVCIHWGNSQDHQTVNGWSPELGGDGYRHVDNWDPTTHAHDIKIGTIDCAGFERIKGQATDGDKSALAICAAYNVTVDEIIMDGACHAVHVTAADLGFEYASEEVKAIKQANIYIKKITGKNLRSAGVYIPGETWYLEGKYSDTEIKIDEIYVESITGNTNYAVAAFDCEKVEIGKITYKGFNSTTPVYTDGSKSVSIGEVKQAE